MEFHRNGTLCIVAEINDDNSAFLDSNTTNNFENVMSILTLPADIMLWHRRFHHYHYVGINQAITQKLVTGISLESKKPQDPICEPCLAGKMHANPFPASNNHASTPLELIHSDVHDVGHHTFTGYRYWVTFIDDYS